MKRLVLVLILMSFSVLAQGKVSLNSKCYMLDQGGQQKIEGDHSNELFEIASVSKVITSYWMLHELTPVYRFSTRIFITPVARDLYDVHIQGAQDPFWGRELTHFLFAELNRNHVTSIRNLTFDEYFSFRWLVISDYMEPIQQTPQMTATELARHIRNLASEYPRTRIDAAKAGITLPAAAQIRAQNVGYVARADFRSTADTRAFVLRSAPLFRYLKEMNTVSNNHVADRLFEILGGPVKFKSFIQSDFNFSERDVQFINGSGDSIVVGKEPNGRDIKTYNQATCESIVRVVYKMHTLLQKKYGMDLKDVMAVSGADGGTLSPRFDSIPNSLVAKTGTVDPAVTLAGSLATNRGDVYFGVFMNTDSPADWNRARDQVRDEVKNLITQYGGRRTFSYTSQHFMPFDSYSSLAMEMHQVEGVP